MIFAAATFSLIYIASTFGLVAVLVTLVALRNAPEGVESSEGFHAVADEGVNTTSTRRVPAYAYENKGGYEITSG